MLHERVHRRTLLKAAGGLLVASVLDLHLPGRQAAAMTRMQWTEQGVFPSSGLYQSTVFRPDQPFNSIEVSWVAALPQGSSLRFSVRFSRDGSSWSDWIDLHVDTDARDARNQVTDRTYAGPVLTAPSQALQYRAEFIPNALGQPPRLEQVEVAAVDTSPPASFLSTGQAAPSLIDGFIIPRAGWGADESLRFDSKGNEIWPPDYREIQKVIVHHTVTQNEEADPAATVRAVYYYHAITRGWGDIGYNFLVDWHGNVYEGRYGGPDVVGGHALQYNWGSIGIAVLGTYDTFDPLPASLTSLERLIKDRAPNLDPGLWTFFIDKDNVPNIAGHRDVLVTDCPGDRLYAKLPDVRGAVKGTGPITASLGVPASSARLLSVSFSPTTVYAGIPIRVDAVIQNTSSIPIYGQEPNSGFTYLEGQDFDSANYPKIEGSYRVGVDFSGNPGLPNPFRWGTPAPLAPGQQATITGYIRLATPGTKQLTASLVQELMRYEQDGVFPATVTVNSPPTVGVPNAADPTVAYYQATQHNVPNFFQSYWASNGGLMMFGYPLTETFEEVSPTDGKTYPTQYFERARFEHHLEFQGTPYEVELGLLGREVTANRTKEKPFLPIPAFTPTADRDYYPQTGHSLALGFRSYWHANGGLPVFGYPISEEFQELSETDGKMHTVQYFERARFEWHPEFRGTQYEYLLGQLGREILINRGWIKAGS
ncbi:MAG TPA: N-acetylmuramoyl-L-alanine amidase [Thermomicrobiaceae bacterium]|nr:N-acetylmuramoyl-L-alanine amidase [Thermomicrobiaceae bacterium]